MSDRLADAINDVDALLDEVDREAIAAAVDAGETDEVILAEALPDCRWCGHHFHGLPCHPGPQAAVTEGGDFYAVPDGSWAEHWECRCESSLTSRDDSWRPPTDPRQASIGRKMDETGMDGWAAIAASSIGTPWDTLWDTLLGAATRSIDEMVRAFIAAPRRAAQPRLGSPVHSPGFRGGRRPDFVIYDEVCEWRP